jgi:hypothetical protein
MKKVDKITGWTDYPFIDLGDEPGKEAPIRRVRVMDYDGDKYVTVGFIGLEPKVGHKVIFDPKVFTHRHYVPHYDDYKGKGRHWEVIELCEEEGHYTGHIMLAERVWNGDDYDLIPMKHAVHDDEVLVISDMKRGYLYNRPQRFNCGQRVVNGDKIRLAFGFDTIARYYAKQGVKVKRDRWGFTFL